MKKKMMAVVLAAACMVTAIGCGKKEISDKYVTISQYKGVEAEKVTKKEVKEEDITSYIESVLEENRENVTDRALKKGDMAQVEYTGKLKKEVFDEGTLVIGNGDTFVEGFEEGIYGHKINETFKLPITFPEGYGGEAKPELSGAKVVFTLKIKAIKGPRPELDDKFVQKVSKKSKTVEEYKKEVREEVQKYYEEEARVGLLTNVWNEVLKNVTVKEYPQDRVDKLVKMVDDQLQENLKDYGMKFEEYLAQNGLTEEDYKNKSEEDAKQYLKGLLTAELIAEEEGIKLSDKDYEKIMKEYAEKYQFDSVEQMTEYVGGEQPLKEIIFQDKVKELLAKNCKQVEPKADDAKEETTDKE